ncbi:MAG: hypothetical protein Q7S84_02290 [bacterium]|nr:hypothetical protein [bacterium]
MRNHGFTLAAVLGFVLLVVTLVWRIVGTGPSPVEIFAGAIVSPTLICIGLAGGGIVPTPRVRTWMFIMLMVAGLGIIGLATAVRVGYPAGMHEREIADLLALLGASFIITALTTVAVAKTPAQKQ